MEDYQKDIVKDLRSEGIEIHQNGLITGPAQTMMEKFDRIIRKHIPKNTGKEASK